MAIDKEYYAQMANESEHLRPTPIQFPTVKLDGNTGKFKIREIQEDGTYDKKGKEVGDVFEGVILRIRTKLSEFTPNTRKSSSEFDSPKERIVLWETKSGAAVKIGEGTAEELRKEFQKLRYNKIVYFLRDGQVYKFRIKGGSLGHWFSYLQELSKKKLHTFEVLTRIQPNYETQKESGLSYYACVFEDVRRIPDDEWERSIKPEFERVNDNINILKEVYARKVPKEDLVEAGVEQAVAVEEVPVVDLDEANETFAEDD